MGYWTWTARMMQAQKECQERLQKLATMQAEETDKQTKANLAKIVNGGQLAMGHQPTRQPDWK